MTPSQPVHFDPNMSAQIFQMASSLARIAHALEAIAAHADPKFKDLNTAIAENKRGRSPR